jgi:hypothetical protein
MDRERLTRLLDHPERTGKDDITDLQAMVERYPWFSGAHLLLAVGDHATGDVLFDEQLRTTAAHLPSRAVLFDLVHREPIVSPDPVKEPSAPSSLEALPIPPPATPSMPNPVERLDAPAPAAEPPVQMQAEQAVEPPPSILEEPERTAPEELRADEEQQVPIEQVPENTPSPDPLDKQIRDAAWSNSYSLLIDSLPPPAAGPSPAPRAVTPVPVLPSVVMKAPPKADDRMRFTEWLKDAAHATVAEAPPAFLPAVPSLEATPTPPPDTSLLIDRFIQGSVPPPPARKAEFFTPQQAAKRSLEDHADLVSETLARVYEKQGNIAKAIAAYERLAQKHPERSAYFQGLAQALGRR